jgi:hypothetical protein
MPLIAIIMEKKKQVSLWPIFTPTQAEQRERKAGLAHHLAKSIRISPVRTQGKDPRVSITLRLLPFFIAHHP